MSGSGVEPDELWSQIPDSFNGVPASLRLGGFVVYARSQSTLQAGVSQLSEAILCTLRAHASLDRKLLLSAVAKTEGSRLDQRVFDAVLAAQLRLGLADRIPCASENGKVFRILIAAERLPEFTTRLSEVRSWLHRERRLPVRAVRDRYFDGSWGTWWSAAHLLSRLALLGAAQHLDRYSFGWPEGLDDALR